LSAQTVLRLTSTQEIVIARLIKPFPSLVKHPFLTFGGWVWNLRGLPSQSPRDISIFKDALLASQGHKLQVFEWGSGRSTIYYSKFLKSVGRDFEWHAMDNSPKWCERGQEKITRAHLSDQVHVYCSEFPAFWQLPGYTHNDIVLPHPWSTSDNVLEYVDFPKRLGVQFDVIIVDGRFRRRCLLVAREVLASNGVVILHDAQRAHYHSSLSSYPHVRFLETGFLPGSTQKSTLALCSLVDDPLIPEM
jgi:hypothetical protein